MVRPKTANITVSCVLNFKEKFASAGAIVRSAINPMIVPQKEAVADSIRASVPWPSRAIACPSHPVAAADGVPGVLTRIAEMEPP